MEISILQPEVEYIPRIMAFCDWMVGMSQLNIIKSYNLKVIVSTSFELTLSNRKFQSAAWRNSIFSPEDQYLPRRIAYSLNRKLEISPSQVIFTLQAGR
jgi:hypothetical protein